MIQQSNHYGHIWEKVQHLDPRLQLEDISYLQQVLNVLN